LELTPSPGPDISVAESPADEPPIQEPPPAMSPSDSDLTMNRPDSGNATIAPAPLTDAMIAEANQTLAKVRDLIRQARWTEMKAAADAATQMPLTETQKVNAQSLYELAELATYYRGGIERALDDLTVGSELPVTDSFRVIVVEKAQDLLVVRYNGKNRSFTMDEFPLSLAHRLASFNIPASPTTTAAKAAYQAIAPKTTDAYRAEAIDWLRQINEEIEGADPKRLADTIARLFAEDA
jgi:hypothetical protein